MTGNEDWRIRNTNHKTVKQEQKDRNNWSITRIGAIIFAVVIVLLKNIPDDFADILDVAFLIAALPFIGMILLAAFPFTAALIIYLILRRKRKQDVSDEYDVPRTYSQYEKPVEFDSGNAVSTSGRDYSNIVDSWDIKDPKPPWEL